MSRSGAEEFEPRPGGGVDRPPTSRSSEGPLETPEVAIRRATADDLETVLELLAEGGREMVARGEPCVWPDPFPAEKVAPLLEAGGVYVGVVGAGGIVGTLTLVEQDPAYWGERSHPCAHLHRMAVRRSFGGRGVGRRMVEWAVREATARGARILRLECLRDASSLRTYYESLGFRRIGDAEVTGLDLALYERPLSDGDAAPPPGTVR